MCASPDLAAFPPGVMLRPPPLALRTALLLALSPLGAPSLADEFWVDAVHGDDANGGTGPADAWRTITHALDRLGPAPGFAVDTVCVLPGVYGDDTEEFPLVLRDRVRLLGVEGSAGTVLEGGLVVGFGSDPTRPSTGAEGLTIRGAGVGIAMFTPGPERPVREATFRGIELEDCGEGIHVTAHGKPSRGSSFVLEDSTIARCSGPGTVKAGLKTELTVTLTGVRVDAPGPLRGEAANQAVLDLLVTRSTFRAPSYLGAVRTVETGDGTARAVVRDSEIHGASSGGDSRGLFLDGGEAVVERCTFWGLGTAVNLLEPETLVVRDSIFHEVAHDLGLHPGGQVTVENCILDDPAFVGQNGNVAADPLFVAPGAGDFRLRFGSPAVDRLPGSDEPDRSGRPRNTDGDLDTLPGADLGAHELATLDGPRAAGLGDAVVLRVHGETDRAAYVQLSLCPPLATPDTTPFGLRWLPAGTYGTVAAVKTTGDLPASVALTAPTDPSLIGETVGYQALVRTSGPAGAAWSDLVPLTLEP